MKPTFTGLVAVALAVAFIVCVIDPKSFDPTLFAQPAPAEAELEVHRRPASVVQIDWSADGRWILALSRHNLFRAGPLAVLDLGDGFEVLLDDGEGQIGAAVLAPDGRHVLAACRDGRLLWIDIDWPARVTLAELPRPGSYVNVAVSPDGAQAAFASESVIYVGQTNGDFAPRQLDGHRDVVRQLKFSDDGRRLASAGHDGDVRIWDPDSGQCIRCLRGHPGPVTRAAFVADGWSVLSAGLGSDGQLCLWDAERGIELWKGNWHRHPGVSALAVAPHGRTAASSGFDGMIVIWDLETPEQKLEIDGNLPYPRDLKFSPDGSLLASAGVDGAIYIWDVRSGTNIAIKTTAHLSRPRNGAE